MFAYLFNLITRFLFNPRKVKNYNDHCALYKKGTKDKKRVLIFAHGMSGSIYYSDKKIKFLNDICYNHDVYFIEYPGYSGLKGTPTVDSCTDEVYFWYNHLKSKYDKIDFYGVSIGGGVILNCIDKYQIIPHNVYLHSTFTSIRDVLYSFKWVYKPFWFIMYIFGLNCLNNQSVLQKMTCNKLTIFHSYEDDLIKFENAKNNFDTARLNDNIKTCNIRTITGNHRNCYQLQ